MLRTVIRRALASFAILFAISPGAPARADTEVDLALVIAVDISYSMDMDELALQRQGFADAFRSPQVHDAIRRGLLGKIAVVYFEWAGSWDQRVIVPWSVLDGPESASGFAEKVAAQPVRRAQRTSISGAIDFAMKLLKPERRRRHPPGHRHLGRRAEQPGPGGDGCPRRGARRRG